MWLFVIVQKVTGFLIFAVSILPLIMTRNATRAAVSLHSLHFFIMCGLIERLFHPVYDFRDRAVASLLLQQATIADPGLSLADCYQLLILPLIELNKLEAPEDHTLCLRVIKILQVLSGSGPGRVYAAEKTLPPFHLMQLQPTFDAGT